MSDIKFRILVRILHRINDNKNLDHFIQNIRFLYVTFLIFTGDLQINSLFFTFYDSYEIMIRGEEHLYVFYLILFILTPFDGCFCVDSFCFFLNQFALSISRSLIFSVSLGLPKIQLFDLDWLTDLCVECRM